MKLNSLHAIIVLSALIGLLSTPLSVAASPLSDSPDVAEVLRLVQETTNQNLSATEQRAQLGQILESTALPSLYSARFGPFGGEIRERTSLSLANWKAIADYLQHTGFTARLIDSLGKKHSRSKYAFESLTDCVLREERCRNLDFQQDVLLNRAYFKFNENRVPSEIAFQEVRGLINSQIILANSNICDLMKSGLTRQDVMNFLENLYMTDSLGAYFLANQRLGAFALYLNIKNCNPNLGNWEMPDMEEFLTPWTCKNQGNRKICERRDTP